MKSHHITLEALGIDPLIYFHGTDEEIQAAEDQEAARAAEVEKIIFSPAFMALSYTNHAGQTRILSHSTRPGVLFQLSYIAADGVPNMHENYIKADGVPLDECAIHSKADLLRFFVNATIQTTITAEVITA